jgi:hypothetical protein
MRFTNKPNQTQMTLTTNEFSLAFCQVTKDLSIDVQKLIWEMSLPEPVCPGAPKKPRVKYGRSNSY